MSAHLLRNKKKILYVLQMSIWQILASNTSMVAYALGMWNANLFSDLLPYRRGMTILLTPINHPGWPKLATYTVMYQMQKDRPLWLTESLRDFSLKEHLCEIRYDLFPVETKDDVNPIQWD